eukprot:15121654-Ditylum_brightwellii.AAC.1
MIASFNSHMMKVFLLAWVSYLDDPILMWASKWTCPGWMFVPRKPHPMVNEYHTIVGGESSIVYTMEMLEGQDRLKEGPKISHTKQGTGKVVILDSGCCVLGTIINLRKKRILASALIKKHHYWTKNIDSEAIKEYMAYRE